MPKKNSSARKQKRARVKTVQRTRKQRQRGNGSRALTVLNSGRDYSVRTRPVNAVVSPAFARTARGEGLSPKDRHWSGFISKFRATMNSYKDMQEAALIANTVEPTRHYPLPGIYVPGIVGAGLLQAEETAGAGNNMLAPTGNQGGITFSSQQTATPIAQFGGLVPVSSPSFSYSYIDEQGSDVAVSRYTTFRGSLTFTYQTVTNANGEADIFFLHDFQNLESPLMIFDAQPANKNATIVNGWTANPYPFAKQYKNYNPQQAANVNDMPWQLETNNLYFTGNAVMQVETLNRNSWQSTSYQTRTGDNVADRFSNNIANLFQFADPTFNFGLLDTPCQADGAVSAYMGQQWYMGRQYNPGSTATNQADTKLQGTMRSVWNTGAPWIRCVVRTQSNGAPASGPIQFKITISNWVGIAPTDIGLASSCPLETLPLAMPTWTRAVRTRGCTFMAGQAQEAAYAMLSAPASIIPMMDPTPMANFYRQAPNATALAATQLAPLELPAPGFLDNIMSSIRHLMPGADRSAARRGFDIPIPVTIPRDPLQRRDEGTVSSIARTALSAVGSQAAQSLGRMAVSELAGLAESLLPSLAGLIL